MQLKDQSNNQEIQLIRKIHDENRSTHEVNELITNNKINLHTNQVDKIPNNDQIMKFAKELGNDFRTNEEFKKLNIE